MNRQPSVVPQISKQNPDFRREGEGEFLFLPQEVDESSITISEEPSDDNSSVVLIESTAILFVESTPKGATVKIDGKSVGTTPCTVKVDTGVSGKREVRISVSKSGYLSKDVTTELIGGKRFEWKDIDLVKLTATLIVDSEPRGATVYVDDQRKGTTRCSMELNVDLNGRRETIVAVSKDGYLTQRANVKLIAGKTARWTDIKLEPSTSSASTPISGKKEIVWEKDNAEMVLIPAGEFEMGSNEYDDEKPVHTVYLDTFYMDKYEVTVGRYKKFINATGYSAPNWSFVSKYSPTDEHPMVYVSWNDAQEYCKWAGKRLPTEAEWEKAARSGLDRKRFPWGNENPDGTQCNFADRNTDYDWSDKNVDDGYQYTAPVGSFPPNGYGLYDMAGNVWEWCNDWYDSDYYSSSPSKNPPGPSSGERRVCRGGSWNGIPSNMRVADRDRSNPADPPLQLGFSLCSLVPSFLI